MVNPFRRPYRETGTKRDRFLKILAFGFFIFLFLFLFKPFGIYELEPLKQFFFTLGFGLITTFVLLVFKYLIEPALKITNLTLGKNILWDVLIASSIGTANYFYINVIFKTEFNILYLLYTVWAAILVGSIPVTIIYVITYNRMYRVALKDNAVVDGQATWEEQVRITAGNNKNDLHLNPKKIIYICSNDNYVTIVTNKEGDQNKITIRGTLKSAENELKKNNRFIRCHKCYIINLDYVGKVTGNFQSMKIKLSGYGTEIPVARSMAAEIRKRVGKR
jgi:hypothetical protein